MATKNEDIKNRDSNPDLITGEPGSHPIGTGLGAAGGGAAGAAVGSVAGPVGTVVGAVAGGLGGKGAAEAVDPTGEDEYWRAQHSKQPYAAGSKLTYEDYAPAYRTGYEGFSRYESGARFDEAEPTLREDYLALAGESGTSNLPWDQAKTAARHAWDRVDRGEAVRVQLSEEQLKVGKREVEGGSVRLRKIVRNEDVSESVQLHHDEVTIDRVSTGNLAEVPADAFQEGTIEVPLKREEAVVEKTAKVVGEVNLKKNVKTDTETIRETLRKEDVEIDSEGEAKITGDETIMRSK